MKQTFVLSSKKKLLLTLLPIAGLVLAFLSMVVIPGRILPTFAHPACDAGWQYDIEFTGLHLEPLSDPQYARNPYNDKDEVDLAVAITKTKSAQFEAGLETEAGLLFEKVKAKFGVTGSQATRRFCQSRMGRTTSCTVKSKWRPSGKWGEDALTR